MVVLWNFDIYTYRLAHTHTYTHETNSYYKVIVNQEMKLMTATIQKKIQCYQDY